MSHSQRLQKKTKHRLISSMPGSHKICLTNQFLQPISLFSGYETSDYTQKEKMGCHASTDTFKNVFKKHFQLLSSFPLLTYCFTRSRYREKPLFSAWQHRGKTPLLLFQLKCLLLRKHKKIVLAARKRNNNIARQKNYLKSAFWGLTHVFCLG